VTEEQAIKDVVTVVSEQVEVVVVGFGEVVELVVVEAGGGWPDPSWLNKLTRPPSTKTTRVNKPHKSVARNLVRDGESMVIQTPSTVTPAGPIQDGSNIAPSYTRR
jgi:hypothetical protein